MIGLLCSIAPCEMIDAMMKRGPLVAVLTVSCLALAGCESVFVPKQHGIGWTLNWANPVAYVVVAAIIGFVIWRLAGRDKQ